MEEIKQDSYVVRKKKEGQVEVKRIRKDPKVLVSQSQATSPAFTVNTATKSGVLVILVSACVPLSIRIGSLMQFSIKQGKSQLRYNQVIP